MLKIQNVSHRYGEHTVLQNISLTLATGQRIAIMGPSGCGKTTLLRIAMGLMKPTEGSVENTFQTTSAVFQEPRLLPWRTALENVNLVLGDRKETLVKSGECLSQLNLSDAADKYPRELSGGMQQRVAIARALAVNGDLLILDEPFKGLDEALREQVIGEVSRTEAAVLLVTHDRQEAELLGCKILNI